MLKQNIELMRDARGALRNKWGIAIGTVVINIVIWGILSWLFASPVLFGKNSVIQEVYSFIFHGPLTFAMIVVFLNISRDKNPQIAQYFRSLKLFGKAFVLHILMVIFILLWLLLLVIPGLMALFSYSLSYCIMADNPNIGARQIITLSKQMMLGNRMKLFYLFLRFIPWILLGILTLGIGFLWISPYIITTFAKFYDDVKANYIPQENTQEPSPSQAQE